MQRKYGVKVKKNSDLWSGFFRSLRHPLRGVGPTLRAGSGAGGLTLNHFSIFEIPSKLGEEVPKELTFLNTFGNVHQNQEVFFVKGRSF